MKNKMKIETTIDSRNTHRNLIVNDIEVSHVAVVNYETRIDNAIIRTAGIGDVRTLDGHQGKGYCRYLMEDTIKYMKDEGYDVSTLIGIPDFYDKFGYSSATPHVESILNINRIKNLKPKYSSRKVLDSDFDFIVHLYNNNNKDLTGTVVRDRAHFYCFYKGSEWFAKTETFIITNEYDKPIGYFVFDKNDSKMNVIEVEAISNEVYDDILQSLDFFTRKKNITDIKLFLPVDHDFIVYIRRFWCETKISYTSNSMNMSRICNLKSLMKKLQDQISSRANNITIDLNIKTEEDNVILSIYNGNVSIKEFGLTTNVLQIPQNILIQVLYGYRKIKDTIKEPGVYCTNIDDFKLLEPTRPSYLYLADFF